MVLLHNIHTPPVKIACGKNKTKSNLIFHLHQNKADVLTNLALLFYFLVLHRINTQPHCFNSLFIFFSIFVENHKYSWLLLSCSYRRIFAQSDYETDSLCCLFVTLNCLEPLFIKQKRVFAKFMLVIQQLSLFSSSDICNFFLSAD